VFVTFNNPNVKNKHEKEVTVAEIEKPFVAYVKIHTSKSGASRLHCSNTSRETLNEVPAATRFYTVHHSLSRMW
jgi:hypothetical protein